VIEPVERADDPRIREYRHTGNPAWLRRQGLFVAEGRLVLKRLLDSGRFPVRSILLTPPALQSFGASLDTPAPIFVASPDLLRELTGFDFHRGCLALAHRASEDPIGGRFADAELLLAIEGVGNPDNIGGLFRAAAAFGVDGVLLDPASADPFYRQAVRSSRSRAAVSGSSRSRRGWMRVRWRMFCRCHQAASSFSSAPKDLD
jgi:tRNA G18 (ribose-2'-O)-methylase SpoU